ncbi:SDR family oxidoreductase [Actinoplanes sp. TRM 88003]|uniref:SDR family oxidoreductase n=1 Tax=Paractinoplanes aksuensis TaxID=2939490 RepID=A0ABT1DTP9_9ACTN|nr:SDR family oxidoreductase [Actinoplanes aksuensis]MCO8274233.1 SDR family oxidoreductase [Actinoplanes aksuensis]
MKVVVVGGTGLIGRKLIPLLTANGHEAVAVSKSTGVDVITGEGLADALRGADTVVDLTNAPSWGDDEVLAFFTTSARNLAAAEQAAGVRHHFALTIVNADTIPDSGYMRAKVAQEKVIAASGIPYTIVRATQFYEFIGMIAGAATVDGQVRVTSAAFQPVAGDDVAALLAELIDQPPLNGLIDLGGPEVQPMSTFVKRFLDVIDDTRTVVPDPAAGYFGATIDDSSLTTRDGARIGATTFAEWLSK